MRHPHPAPAAGAPGHHRDGLYLQRSGLWRTGQRLRRYELVRRARRGRSGESARRTIAAGPLIASLDERILADIELLGSTGALDGFLSDAPTLVGPASGLLRHPSSDIQPGCVIDTSDGPVIIDKGARISRLSYLAGPVYVGEKRPDSTVPICADRSSSAGNAGSGARSNARSSTIIPTSIMKALSATPSWVNGSTWAPLPPHRT